MKNEYKIGDVVSVNYNDGKVRFNATGIINSLCDSNGRYWIKFLHPITQYESNVLGFIGSTDLYILPEWITSYKNVQPFKLQDILNARKEVKSE